MVGTTGKSETGRVIGKRYTQSDKERLTPVEYKGSSYQVRENLWTNNDESSWQVTLVTDGPPSDIQDRQDMHEYFCNMRDAVEVLGALDYELCSVEPDTEFVIWEKSADT